MEKKELKIELDEWTLKETSQKTGFEPKAVVVRYGVKITKPNGKKPYTNYWFRSPSDRQAYIDSEVENFNSYQKYMAERRARAKATLTNASVKVGDIYYTSWGYDQTNVEFYEVVKLVGKCSVILREIAGESEQTGFTCGTRKPMEKHYIGLSECHRVQDNGQTIHIDEVRTGFKWHRQPVAYSWGA